MKCVNFTWVYPKASKPTQNLVAGGFRKLRCPVAGNCFGFCLFGEFWIRGFDVLMCKLYNNKKAYCKATVSLREAESPVAEKAKIIVE